MQTTGQDYNRNPEGKGGFGDNPQNINPGGEPKNSLKNYVASKLAKMSDEQKDEYIAEMNKENVWKMAEGNPANNTDLTSKGERIKGNEIIFTDFRENGTDSK